MLSPSTKLVDQPLRQRERAARLRAAPASTRRRPALVRGHRRRRSLATASRARSRPSRSTRSTSSSTTTSARTTTRSSASRRRTTRRSRRCSRRARRTSTSSTSRPARETRVTNMKRRPVRAVPALPLGRLDLLPRPRQEHEQGIRGRQRRRARLVSSSPCDDALLADRSARRLRRASPTRRTRATSARWRAPRPFRTARSSARVAPYVAGPRARGARRRAADVDRGAPRGRVAGRRQGARADAARASRSSRRLRRCSRRSRRGTRGSRATTSIACSRSCIATSDPAGRAARAPLDATDDRAASRGTRHALDELPEWPEQRYLDYLAAIDTQDKAQGVGGVESRRLLARARCATCSRATRSSTRAASRAARSVRAGGDARGRAGDARSRASRSTACGWKVLGPFTAGDGDGARSRRIGDGDADLYVRRGAAPDADDVRLQVRGRHERRDVHASTATAPIYVAVFGAKPSSGRRSTSSTSPRTSRDPTCLDGEMPRDAVLVKADWRRELARRDAADLRHVAARACASGLAAGADWADGDGAAIPTRRRSTRVTLPNGNVFRMPALHIMTKELDHWLWITLWWSPQPDTDFGADRPAAIASLPGPWKNYKMCVASSYLEGDPDPRGGQPGSLGDALAAVNGGVGAPTWCSNPYLELGAGNAQTNCIGCHQHGGTTLTPEVILATSRTTARRACGTTSSPTTCGRSRAARARISRRSCRPRSTTGTPTTRNNRDALRAGGTPARSEDDRGR